jgi:type IV pilus assembly protein PilQ
MSALLRTILVTCFAALGVVVAVWLGNRIPARADHPRAALTDQVARQSTQHDPSQRDPAQGDSSQRDSSLPNQIPHRDSDSDAGDRSGTSSDSRITARDSQSAPADGNLTQVGTTSTLPGQPGGGSPSVTAALYGPAPYAGFNRDGGIDLNPASNHLPEPSLAEVAPPVGNRLNQDSPASTLSNLLDVLQTLGQNNSVPLPQPAAQPNTPVNRGQGLIGSGIAPARPRQGSGTADIQGEGDEHLSIHIQDADIREVLELLSAQGNLNILATPGVQGSVSAVLNDVDLETALQSILKAQGLVARREGNVIYVGLAEEFEAIQRSQGGISRRIYRPNYVTAAELNAVIAEFLTPNVGKISVTSPSQVGIESNSSAAGGDAFAGTDAVLVQDFEGVLQQIDRVVQELDQQPAQVHIEAMILSVSVNDSNTIGIDWEFLRQRNQIRFGVGQPRIEPLNGGGTTNSATGGTTGEYNYESGGLAFAFLDSNLGAFVVALEQIGDTNVIATPRLMCLNKQSAEVLIGAELGYVSTTVTDTSATQSVEFLEVGTSLRLRPFIYPDGQIRLEVHPELSTGQVRVEEGFTLPDKEVTQVTTAIMVPDGQTAIIAGLMREDLKTTTSQIPFLGSLPGVGFLFRTKQEEVDRREILVLLTPRIVNQRQMCCEGEQGACEFHRRQAVYADRMNPFAKRNMARRYRRAAQGAWANYNRELALQYVNLSVQFDPENRASIDLREDILAGRHDGPHSGGVVLPFVPETHPLEGEVISPWLLDEMENQESAPRIEVVDPPRGSSMNPYPAMNGGGELPPHHGAAPTHGVPSDKATDHGATMNSVPDHIATDHSAADHSAADRQATGHAVIDHASSDEGVSP